MIRKLARVRITDELLFRMLHFPPGTMLRAATCPDGRSLEIVVEHPDLRDVRPGDAIPEACPQITEHVISFDGWGQL
jgi:hypothetical protein